MEELTKKWTMSDARKKFGNDTFYKITNKNNDVIVVSNNIQFIESEKSYWDEVYEKSTEVEVINFDDAYKLVQNDPLIIRRFY